MSRDDVDLLIAYPIVGGQRLRQQKESYRKLGSLPASPQVSGVMARVSDKTQSTTGSCFLHKSLSRADFHFDLVIRIDGAEFTLAVDYPVDSTQCVTES